MKTIGIVALIGWLGMQGAWAEKRVFTNKDGKALEAELLSVEENKAVLKLGNGKEAKVSMDTLSEADQAFIKTWWEENKDKIKPTDVVLSLKKETGNPDREKHATRAQDFDYVSKKYSYDTWYICDLRNRLPRDINEITITYTIHMLSRGGSRRIGSRVETVPIPSLKSRASMTFETVAVRCVETSGTYYYQDNMKEWAKVFGISMTLRAGGEEILTIQEPADLPEILAKEDKK